MNATIKVYDSSVNIKKLIMNSGIALRPESDKELIKFINHSLFTWVGYIDEEPACIWGVLQQSIGSDEAYIWLLVTKAIEQYKLMFVRNSRIHVTELLQHYTCLRGHCDVGDDKAIRFARYLGAEFGEYEDKMIPFWIGDCHG